MYETGLLGIVERLFEKPARPTSRPTLSARRQECGLLMLRR
jgi:hypothetical protein